MTKMAIDVAYEELSAIDSMAVADFSANSVLDNCSLEQLIHMIVVEKEGVFSEKIHKEVSDLHELNKQASWLLDLKAKLGAARSDKGELSLKDNKELIDLLKEAKEKYNLQYDEKLDKYKSYQVQELIDNVATLLKKIGDKQSIILSINMPELMNMKNEYLLNCKKCESVIHEAKRSINRSGAAR